MMFYASPILYTLQIVAGEGRRRRSMHLLAVNPFTAAMQQARHALFGAGHYSAAEAIGGDRAAARPAGHHARRVRRSASWSSTARAAHRGGPVTRRRGSARAAPRARPALEWTGERMLPWIDDPAIAYEHLHRYAFAARARRGPPRARPRLRRGLRHGAAGHARRLGRRRRRRPCGHRARRGDIRGAQRAASCARRPTTWRVRGRVVRRRRLLRGDRARRGAGAGRGRGPARPCGRRHASSARLPSATRTASGPARRTRSTSASSTREFRALLTRGFPMVALWAQLTMTGSLLEPLAGGDAPGGRLYVERDGELLGLRERPEPLYLSPSRPGHATRGHRPCSSIQRWHSRAQQRATPAERAERELREARHRAR